MASKPKAVDSEDDYKAQSDADTLQRHAEITSDPARHAKAHAVLQTKADTAQAAVKTSSKGLHGRVKKGLNKAFPAGKGGKTPYEAAGENK